MATAILHAISSSKRWGGTPEDYLAIHEWFDSTKAHQPDFRHRALRHHAEGIFLMESIFGTHITTSDGRLVPTKWIGEQHVMEDIGRIPVASDWLRNLTRQPWMTTETKRLEKLYGTGDIDTEATNV